ncbi:MAG: DUF4199 domain-containing protein [Kangiellaceae bacterium]|nr:DUF4199 domain-containing protein [Kangiellaceae bacterium]
MKNNIMKFGLIAGTIIVMIPLITGLIIGYGPETYKTGEIVGYSTIILSLMMIFLAVKEYQKRNPEQTVGFLKILAIGAGISFIAGLMFGIYNVIYVTYIDPEFMHTYYQYYIQSIQSSGASAEVIEQQIAQLEKEKEMFMDLTFNFALMFLTVFMIGLVVSVISGLLQREKQELGAGG